MALIKTTSEIMLGQKQEWLGDVPGCPGAWLRPWGGAILKSVEFYNVFVHVQLSALYIPTLSGILNALVIRCGCEQYSRSGCTKATYALFLKHFLTTTIHGPSQEAENGVCLSSSTGNVI